MKRVYLTIALAVLLIGCSKQGEIQQAPQDFIIIHGKTYKLMKIVPADNERAIWIMYPKDSTDAQPEVINWDFTTNNGKSRTTHRQSLIKVN